MRDGQEHLPYWELAEGGSAEIVEKKSRFIATLAPVREEKEAAAFIESVRRKYWDARHNCSAFVIGERGELTRCSDDGEPAGTAGKPMLQALLNKELRNTAAVVTRYFGGTLLGTGGLVRAYGGAVQAGIDACGTVRMRYGAELLITVDYALAEKIRRMLEEMKLAPAEITYSDLVKILLPVPLENEAQLRGALTQLTAGRAVIEKNSEKYFVDK